MRSFGLIYTSAGMLDFVSVAGCSDALWLVVNPTGGATLPLSLLASQLASWRFSGAAAVGRIGAVVKIVFGNLC